jgi:hypothetical protein
VTAHALRFCLELDVSQAPRYPALADGRLVVVTGDPPANPQFLGQALGNVEGAGYAVIDIRCGPALRGKDLALAAPMLTEPSRSGGAVVAPECSATASLLFLFIDFFSSISTSVPIGRSRRYTKAHWAATSFGHRECCWRPSTLLTGWSGRLCVS